MGFGRRTLIKVIVLGDSGVGKTSLMNQYVCKRFSNQYQATMGASFFTKELQIDDKLLTLQIWDTAGQERFRSLGSAFFRGADCCILVFDVNTMMSFENLERWRDGFLKQANIVNPEKFPFVVLGNKTDFNDGNSRVVSEKKARAWSAAKGNVIYIETSAKDNVNVDVAFLHAAQHASKHQAEEEMYFPDSIDVAMSRNSGRSYSCAC